MFTPYYFLAVGFGLFAVVISAIGIKNPEDFPGRFSGLIMLVGVVFGVATFAFVWHGGTQEVNHRKAEAKAAHAAQTSSVSTLPAGARPTS